MKKVISVLLALVMMFSVVSVVFAVSAEDVVATTEAVEEEFDFTSLPAWIVPVALKLAKVLVKIVSVLAKLGIIDTTDIMNKLTDFISGATGTVDTTAAAIA